MFAEKCCSGEPSLKDFRITFFNIFQFLLLVIIRFYQKVVSPALPGNTCRFYPSCSHYGFQAIYKYGAIKGLCMAIGRILRCNPFNEGGYDPLP